MAKVFLIACILYVLYLANAEVVKFDDCTGGEGKGEITQLEVIPCPKQPCELKKGTKVQVKVTFVPHEDLTSAVSVVHGEIGGFPVPFPLPNPDCCKDSGLKCPLKAGQKYVYSSALEIKSAYPAIKVAVKWEMQDPKKQDVFCFEIATKIVS
ncbi:NPC intracellular cholesterol transporter 2-like [Actinia tenebrosa]|uniref:NPC intracellular cholesterol transporter 2-like n=1 Tax=Actinia tenebrosa TaxID=6105 RepID=A0A6P8HQC9_ACTTE|nr:NPC intracellular cholesterol transporter 2-like [Actinia tenebrosa]